REVVEYVEQLPAKFKVRFGQRKWLHRKVCEGFLSQTIMKRKKKAFGVNVVDEWFHGSLDSKLGDYLLDKKSLMFEFLEPTAVHQLLEEHRTRKCDNHKLLFSLIVFEEWLRSNQSVNYQKAEQS
ncbi:MAG: asparagine synthase-related protein, partial [Thiotrichaceae bacterium]